MKPTRVVPAAALATVLTGGAAALAATAVDETSSARFVATVGSNTHVHVTALPIRDTAILNWGATNSVSEESVAGQQWTAYPATFISHMTAGPVAEGAALVRSFIVKLSGILPTDPAAGPVGHGQAWRLLVC